MPITFLDIETRGVSLLNKTGPYCYSEHPNTEITIVSWAADNGPVAGWLPPRYDWNPAPSVIVSEGFTLQLGGNMPSGLRMMLNNPLVAHNVGFERTLLPSPAGQRIGFPASLKDIGRWTCTAAMAAALGLPRSLAGACAALGLSIQKDDIGHKLMLKMCKPRKPRKGEPADALLWHADDADMIREAVYCCRDVEAERAIWNVLPKLSADEREAWEATETSNDLGIPLDWRLITAMIATIDAAAEQINTEISARTWGAVRKVSDHAALKTWLLGAGIDDADETGVGKAAIKAMIENPDMDPFVRSVLIMRRDGGGVSPQKWRALANRTSPDGRLRGAMVYCGAASTGRWASRGAQMHNLPRGGSLKNVDAALRDVLGGATVEEIEFLHGPPMVVVSELLRPAVCAPDGYWIARGDYSQIEARVLPWLAGATHVLDAFRAYDAKTGPDLYRVAAAGIYGVPVDAVTSKQRQIGKVAVLALGFQGGKGAFQAMAKGYSVTVADAEAESIKEAWRSANPEIKGFWRGLEVAAMECMERPPGTQVDVWTWRDVREPGAEYPVWEKWHKTPTFFKRSKAAMSMRLPSGRSIVYWTPRLADKMMPWGKSKRVVMYRSENSTTKRWQEFSGYGGIWCENDDQGLARDIMARAWVRLWKRGLNPFMSVHDEIVCQVSKATHPTAESAARAVEEIMLEPLAWFAGLPIAADSSAGPRYVKA